MFIIFTTHVHVMSPVQRMSSEYRKAYIQQMIFSAGQKMIWTLVYYFTLALHPSDQHVLHYIIVVKNLFLQNLCDLIKHNIIVYE